MGDAFFRFFIHREKVKEVMADTTRTQGTTYGYARVSTRDQNLDRQLDALAAFGVDGALVFKDKASGKDFERPAWQELMGVLKAGDVLVVKSIDRLGRDYDEIIDWWRRITKDMGVAIVVLDMPLLDTRDKDRGITGTLIADLVLQIFSYVAQVEREHIRQRQAEGIEAARARGVRFGRPRKKKPTNWKRTRDDYQAHHITAAEAAKRLKVSPATFGRWMREER